MITSHPMDMTVNNGSNVTFNCASFGYAPITHIWLKNGAPLNDSVNIIISNDSDEGNDTYTTTTVLTILDVQSSDRGMYVCNATNTGGIVSSNAATLSVIGKLL